MIDFGRPDIAAAQLGPGAAGGTNKSSALTQEPKLPLADMISDFHLALLSVTEVTEFGNRKHGTPGGWRNVLGFKRVYQNAKARHALSGLVDEGGLDRESGLPHLAHEAWNALALLQNELEIQAGRREKTARPSP